MPSVDRCVAPTRWLVPFHRSLLTLGVGWLLVILPDAALGQERAFDLDATLARVGARLERRYQHTQRIVSTEKVWVRSFGRDMQSTGPPRRLEFERRVEWGGSGETGAPTMTVFRELRLVNGRAPERRDVDACLTPRAEAEDPLSAMLPVRQQEFEFSLGGVEWIDGRRVARLEYVPLEEGPPEVTWDEECVSISLPGRSRSTAWVVVESGDVLRIDERLARPFEFRARAGRLGDPPGWMVLERDDVSIRYQEVVFSNPAETLMLPGSIEHSWTLRGIGIVPRYYRVHQFSNHRRFVTGGRLVGTPGTTGER